MLEGEVKEVQGHAISVYGNVAVMAKCSESTLMSKERWKVKERCRPDWLCLMASFETCRVQLTTRRNHRPAERTLDRRFNDDYVREIWGEVEVSESRWRQRQLL